MKYAAWLLLLVISSVMPGFADTTWVAEGNAAGQWTIDGSPYMIQGQVAVADTDTLVITSGVTVYFTGAYHFNVNGLLRAIGEADDSVRFTSDTIANPNGWRGLRFLFAHDSCRLDYCIVEFGKASTGGDERYGGNLECRASSPQFNHCTFRHGYALIDGGAIYCREQSAPILQDCEIYGNRTNVGSGGGILTRSSHPVLINCSVHSNWSGQNGGGLAFLSYSHPVVESCTISDNRANLGGGIYSQGANVGVAVSICSITGNTAVQSGGGVYSSGAALTVSRSDLSTNSAPEGGGGTYSGNGGRLVNCMINSNNATQVGGGLACISNSLVMIEHCNIYGNSALQGGAVAITNSSPSLRSSILSGSTSGEGVLFTNSPNAALHNCCIFDNPGGHFGGTLPAFIGTVDTTNMNGDSCDRFGNLFLDPLFVDTGLEDFHLQSASPCIAAGEISTVSEDLDGNPRPQPA